MRGKKGQNLVLALITAVMIFMAGMLFLNQIMNDVELTRSIGLDCDGTTISDGTKITCIGVNLVIPILMIAILSAAAGAILSRFVL